MRDGSATSRYYRWHSSECRWLVLHVAEQSLACYILCAVPGEVASVPITDLFIPRGPEFRREIERDYHLRMTAKNTEDLKTFQAEALKVQAELGAEILRAVERSAEVQPWIDTSLLQMEEYITTLLGGMELVSDSLDVL